jgi:HSP20 family protein
VRAYLLLCKVELATVNQRQEEVTRPGLELTLGGSKKEDRIMIVRWNPFQELDRLQRDMNALFENRMQRDDETTAVADWRPSVDIYEDNERFVLTAELPGIDPTKVDLKVEENRLSLRGERKLEFEDRKENYHRVERFYGTFARTFSLPNTVDGQKIVAEYKNGMLRVTIPKKPEVMPKQISVKINE